MLFSVFVSLFADGSHFYLTMKYDNTYANIKSIY